MAMRALTSQSDHELRLLFSGRYHSEVEEEGFQGARVNFVTTPTNAEKPRPLRCTLKSDFAQYSTDSASAALRAFLVKLALINAILMVFK